MPVDRTLAADLAQTLVGMYNRIEDQLTFAIIRDLRAGIDSPTWAYDKMTSLNRIRQWTTRLLARLQSDAGDEVARAIILAYARGGQAALRELARQQLEPEQLRTLRLLDPLLRRLGVKTSEAANAARIWSELAEMRDALPGLDAMQRLAFSLTSKLAGTHTPILRWVDDVYRQVVATAGLPDVLAGTTTRRRAAQIAWERLITRGVKGFTDKSGRNWELASYVEMATRTGTAQAAVEGHLDRLADLGIDLVIVSNAPQECAKCRPFEGKVLARRGSAGRVEVQHATRDNATVTVEVVATVDQAIARGLMHPNCRHTLGAYLPGVTKAPTHTQDPQGDADRQRLRELERTVRRAKLKAATAIDPTAKAKLNAAVRARQAEIREHVAETGLLRQRPREQIGVAR